MDEAKAVLHLMVQFPYKSEEYLCKTYRRHKCNMSATIAAINDDPPATNRNFFGNLFEGIIDGFQKMCCAKAPEDIQDEEASGTRYEEEFVDINIGEEFAKNLVEKFSDSISVPKGFQPVIEIPVALGRQLYAAYVESVFRQQEAHDQIVADLVKEDEEFARKLQEEEDKQHETGALRKIPTVQFDFSDHEPKSPDGLEELPQVHWTTSEKETDFRRFGGSTESLDETDLDVSTFAHPATFYRDQAQKYKTKRKSYYQKAHRCLKANNRQLANTFFQLAKEQTRLIAEANDLAAAAFLAENGGRHSKNTLDLHHLYVNEAIQALDDFLDEKILSLQDEGLQTRALTIVTGRGKHSLNGIPKIKPAVEERLGERSLKYSELNPGCLRVHIFKHSYLANEVT